MHSQVALTRLLQVALEPYPKRTKKMNLLLDKLGAKASHHYLTTQFKANI